MERLIGQRSRRLVDAIPGRALGRPPTRSGSCPSSPTLAQVGRRVRIGIGGVARSVDEIASSYAEARTALRVGSSTGRESPYDIDDLRVEQLVAALPGRLRSRVGEEIIGSLRGAGDWTATRATVVAWVESGFVLVEAARALNVHRNTLVYRLGRIATETGWPTTDRRARSPSAHRGSHGRLAGPSRPSTCQTSVTTPPRRRRPDLPR